MRAAAVRTACKRVQLYSMLDSMSTCVRAVLIKKEPRLEKKWPRLKKRCFWQRKKKDAFDGEKKQCSFLIFWALFFRSAATFLPKKKAKRKKEKKQRSFYLGLTLPYAIMHQNQWFFIGTQIARELGPGHVNMHDWVRVDWGSTEHRPRSEISKL